jgi:type IV pilus assembly protein PilB
MLPIHPVGIREEWGYTKYSKLANLIQDLILKRSTSAEIQKAAQAEGMITMREDGYLKALNRANHIGRSQSCSGNR